jgi:hypothetical protein
MKNVKSNKSRVTEKSRKPNKSKMSVKASAAKKANTVQPRLADVQTACTILGIGKTKAFDLMAKGTLKRVKIGRKTLVKVSSINAVCRRGDR